jgi:hypothetical protein
MDPIAGLEMVVKRKIPSLCQDSNPQSSSTIPFELFWLLAEAEITN